MARRRRDDPACLPPGGAARSGSGSPRPSSWGTAASASSGGQAARAAPRPPAGLLEKLLAAIRPEFRAEVLAFDPVTRFSADRRARCPAAGAPPASGDVPGAPRAVERRRPARPVEFTPRPTRPLAGHRPLLPCRGSRLPLRPFRRDGLCAACTSGLDAAPGGPTRPGWTALAPRPPPERPGPAWSPTATCGPSPDTPFCLSHGHRWRARAARTPASSPRLCGDRPARSERLDFGRSGPVAARGPVRAAVPPRRGTAGSARHDRADRAASWPRSGVPRCWTGSEQEWREFPPRRPGSQARPPAVQARRAVEDLAIGTGWDVEYPRDTWRLRNLGITAQHAHAATSADSPALAEGPRQAVAAAGG